MKALLRTGKTVVLIVTTLVLQVGCADTAEIRRIVADSNEAVINSVQTQNSELLAAVDAGGGNAALAALGVEDPVVGADDVPGDQAWIVQVDKIERYISEHPKQVRTINALRIRQAILLMQVRQPNLAAAAFNQADENQLFSDRDKAFLALQDEFIWWYSVGDRLSEEERNQGNAAMREIASYSDGLTDGSSTKRLLEQMRVRVGLRVARSLSDRGDIHEKLEDATARYGGQFSAEDRKLVQAWHAGSVEEPDTRLLLDLRWFDYVPSAYDQAEAQWRKITRDSLAPLEFTPPWVACIENDQLPCD